MASLSVPPASEEPPSEIDPRTVDSGDGMEECAPTPERLNQVIDRHYDFLWRSLRRLGVPADTVEDAMQNVFLVAARKLGAVPAHRERAFLFRVSAGIAANIRRGARRRPVSPASDTLEVHASQLPGPEALLRQREARVLLDEVLDELPDNLRIVFVLTEIEEMEAPDLATLLGLPVGTVTSRLRRARALFSMSARRVRARHESKGGTL